MDWPSTTIKTTQIKKIMDREWFQVWAMPLQDNSHHWNRLLLQQITVLPSNKNQHHFLRHLPHVFPCCILQLSLPGSQYHHHLSRFLERTRNCNNIHLSYFIFGNCRDSNHLLLPHWLLHTQEISYCFFW